MGLPSIKITFKSAVDTTIKRAARGVVGLIIRDSTVSPKSVRSATPSGAFVLTEESEIPSTLSINNANYVKRAFIGYVNRPSQVYLYVVPADAADLKEALAYMALQPIDYLCGPAACTSTEADEIAAWIAARRADDMSFKAVLPNKAADSEAIINFTATDIKSGDTTYTTAEYCSRIAGLLAGTPLTISCTFAPLPEISDVKRLSKSELDTAIDVGQLVLFHDGQKVKLGRGVNSLVTTTSERGADYKKIKIVETMDAIKRDINLSLQDTYIGKYANSYDNKCLVITAVQGYLEQLEREGILQAGSSVSINIAEQVAYLKSHGTDTSKMSEADIRAADTGEKLFLAGLIKILDAIEDILLAFGM